MSENLFNTERYQRSLSNLGNPYRLLKLFEKAKKGEEITFATIGGSITASCNASSWRKHYGCLIEDWFNATFPEAKVNFKGAGIGATGSLVGVHRLDRDVLSANPDLVIVEFSVNDKPYADNCQVYYDNLIYKTLNHKTAPAVLCIGTMGCDGINVQDKHIPVAKYYDLPFISFRDSVWCEVESGALKWEQISNDSVHPIDDGHKLMSDLVTTYFEGILDKSSKDYSDIKCDKPLTNLGFQNGKLCYPNTLEAKDLGCFKIRDDINVNGLKIGWVAEENGAPLVIDFKDCHHLFLQFERTNKGDGGKAIAKVQGKEIMMDADFTGGWGVYYNNTCVFDCETAQDVTLEITPDLKEGQHFTLVGVLFS